MRYLIFALLLATSAAADHVVVQPDGSAVVTLTLTADEYVRAQIAHEACMFDDPRNASKDLGEAFLVWLQERIAQLVERAKDLRRQRAAELTPAQELQALRTAIAP